MKHIFSFAGLAVAALSLFSGCATSQKDLALAGQPTVTCHVCRYNNDLACVCVKLKETTPRAEFDGRFVRANPRRKVDRAFIHSMFTRDKPGTSDMAAANALADAELALSDSVPTGTYLDMCVNLPVVDPAQIHCAVCILRGEFDGIATEEDLMDFFVRLPSKDKQFVFISGLAHAATLGVNRHKFWHAMHSFMTVPETRSLQNT